MGEHNLKKKNRRANKWILCSKWFKEILKPIKLTEEEKTAPTPPKRVPEKDYIPYWTPIGTIGKIPFEYISCDKAMEDMKRILNLQPENKGLLYVALKVRYVPGRIKVYNKYWFDKYVTKEVQLKVEDKNKQQDVFEEREEI